MDRKKPYCLMPWIHFHVGNGGFVKACCVANIPYGNINTQDMNEIWYGEEVQKLRDKFSKGEKDNRCGYCIKLEEAGGKSIRQETFEKFSHPIPKPEEVALPVYFDIRFSNVCNFRCRTCWHGASSKWFSDAEKLGTNLGEKAIIKNIEDLNSFLKQCGKALLNTEEIYFAGGEPLVTEEHYQLLEWLIANQATQIRLRYNTNFSTLNFKGKNVLDLWKHFPDIELLASIDGTEALGEYIRKDMVWSSLVSNREKIRPLDHIKFKLAPTVSIFNMHHLPSLYKQCLALNMIQPDALYINILERPFHYNVQAFPPHLKDQVKLIFDDFFDANEPKKISITIKKQFQECLDYMFAKDLSQKHWPTFLKESKKLDLIRNENMKNVLDF